MRQVYNGSDFCAPRSGRAVGRVVDAVAGGNPAQQKRIDALQAGHVVAVLVGCGAALVMGVDAAARAEVVPCRVGVEPVELQDILAADDVQSGQRHRGDDGAPAAAVRAVAAARIDDTVGQVELDHHRAAVAGKPVPGQDRDAVDGSDHMCTWGPGTADSRAMARFLSTVRAGTWRPAAPQPRACAGAVVAVSISY